MVRTLQEYPFKITLSNFEMLRIGAKFFTELDETTVYIDSSGKFWQDRKKNWKRLVEHSIGAATSCTWFEPLSDI